MKLKTIDISKAFHTTWDDMTADQAAVVLDRQPFFNLDVSKEAHGLVAYWTTMMLCRDQRIFRKLSADQVIDIWNDIDIYSKKFHHFHISFFKIKNTKLLAPRPYLEGSSFNQMRWADTEYSKFLVSAYQKDKDSEKYLNRLIAILYQPWANGHPVPFTMDNVQEVADSLPIELTLPFKYLILQSYANIRAWFVQRHAYIFPTSGGDGSPVAPQYTGEMWHEILNSLADLPAFQGMSTAENADYFKVLGYLDHRQKMKAQQKEKAHA